MCISQVNCTELVSDLSLTFAHSTVAFPQRNADAEGRQPLARHPPVMELYVCGMVKRAPTLPSFKKSFQPTILLPFFERLLSQGIPDRFRNNVEDEFACCNHFPGYVLSIR